MGISIGNNEDVAWSSREANLLAWVMRSGQSLILVGEIQAHDNRAEKTSFCIVDAQSVKNTDTAENKGYDSDKKVSGIKKHIAVDTQGLSHAIH